jgi:hypothetical protein
MSMAHSLEVRVPFLDHNLLELAAHPETPSDLLPPGFLKRRKMGFSLPLTVWFGMSCVRMSKTCSNGHRRRCIQLPARDSR